MLKVIDLGYLPKMGFTKNGFDWVCAPLIDGEKKTCFTVYAGSAYIRYSKTSYATGAQLRLVHEWTKEGYIEWEE